MRKLALLLLLLFGLGTFAHAQVEVAGSAGFPAPQLVGWGLPGNTYNCDTQSVSMVFLQLDAGTAGFAPGFIWVCGSTVPGGTLLWRHLNLPQVVDGSGNYLNETCAHVKTTSNTSGAWSATWPSIGNTITSINATSVSTGGTVTGSTQATISTATPTGASGSVITYSSLTVALVNITIPILSNASATVYVQVCATP